MVVSNAGLLSLIQIRRGFLSVRMESGSRWAGLGNSFRMYSKACLGRAGPLVCHFSSLELILSRGLDSKTS